MNDRPERLWTSADVCAYLGLGKNAPADLARRGELPALRIGLRFEPAAVRAFAARCAQRPPATVLTLSRGRSLAKSASLREGEGG